MQEADEARLAFVTFELPSEIRSPSSGRRDVMLREFNHELINYQCSIFLCIRCRSVLSGNSTHSEYCETDTASIKFDKLT